MDYSDIPFAAVSKEGKIKILRHIYFECTGCAACCRVNNIPVTEKDIQRMLDNGIEVDQAIESFSPVLIPSKNVEGNFIKAYFLRKKPFVEDCAFLDEEERCRVHNFKPNACRLYPFSVKRTKDGFLATVHPDTVCRFIEMDVEKERSNTEAITNKLIELLLVE